MFQTSWDRGNITRSQDDGWVLIVSGFDPWKAQGEVHHFVKSCASSFCRIIQCDCYSVRVGQKYFDFQLSNNAQEQFLNDGLRPNHSCHSAACNPSCVLTVKYYMTCGVTWETGAGHRKVLTLTLVSLLAQHAPIRSHTERRVSISVRLV